MGSLYPDASQFNSKVAGGVCRAVCNKQPRRRRLVSSSAYRRASSRLVAGHNNRVSNSDSFRNKRVVCRRYCLTLLSFSFSVSLRPCCPLFGSRDKRLLLTIKTNRFVPLVRQDFPWLSRLRFSIISFPFFFSLLFRALALLLLCCGCGNDKGGMPNDAKRVRQLFTIFHRIIHDKQYLFDCTFLSAAILQCASVRRTLTAISEDDRHFTQEA